MGLSGYLNQTVNLTEYKGVIGGRTTYEDPVTIKVRIEPKVRKIINTQGQEVLTSGRIFFAGGSRYKTGSIINYQGRDYKLMQLEPITGFTESHVEGWLQ